MKRYIIEIHCEVPLGSIAILPDGSHYIDYKVQWEGVTVQWGGGCNGWNRLTWPQLMMVTAGMSDLCFGSC